MLRKIFELIFSELSPKPVTVPTPILIEEEKECKKTDDW